MMTDTLTAKIEALLFYKSDPTELADLAETCNEDIQTIREAVSTLKQQLQDRGLTLIENEGSVQLVTDPEFGDAIKRDRKRQVDTNLTDAQAEALSVIAYLAPTEKTTIDYIRGVNSRAVLRNLSTRGLIEKDRSGQHISYKLATEALKHLGLDKPGDLPKYESTREQLMEFVQTRDEGADNNEA